MCALCRAVGFWATLAFIVSGVVSPMLAASKNPLFGRITRLVSLNNHLVTELCPVPLCAGERIIIICPSPYKDATTGLCGDQLFSIDCEHKSSGPCFWANKRLARLPFIQIAETEVCGYIALENFHTTMIDQMFCGRVASVLQCFPVIRRFLVAVFGVLFGLGLSFWGWVKLDDNRRVFGTALICVGWLISVSGLGLLWLAAFPSTWGWWL